MSTSSCVIVVPLMSAIAGIQHLADDVDTERVARRYQEVARRTVLAESMGGDAHRHGLLWALVPARVHGGGGRANGSADARPRR